MHCTYISSLHQWQKALPKLHVPQLAFDLEFDNNLHHYGFKLCLVQLHNGNETFIFDPKTLDAKLLFPIFESPAIQKIAFAGGEDLRLLHLLGCKPINIYDLMHAYRLLDYQPASLSAILKITLNIDTVKTSQTSDWCTRPLKQNQLKYAREDVLYLLDLYRFLNRQAQQKGLDVWIEQENKALDNLQYNIPLNTNVIPQKFKKQMTEFQWFIFNELWDLREKIARQYDKPPHQIINNRLLLDMASDPTLLDQWLKLPGIFKRIKNKGFQDKLYRLLLQWEKTARRQNISKVKKAIKPLSPEAFQHIKDTRKEHDKIKEEILKPLQNKIANKLGLNAVSFILSNKQMDQLLSGKPILPYKRELFQRLAPPQINQFLPPENTEIS